jgi:hypothetical protein
MAGRPHPSLEVFFIFISQSDHLSRLQSLLFLLRIYLYDIMAL